MSKREDLAALYAPLGGIGERYLLDHVERFRRTKALLTKDARLPAGALVLDIGAHWLHQSVLYAIDGCRVTALDLPDTLSIERVRELAQRYAIRLLINSSLEHPGALAAIADDTFDLVLFTEIIEHLTFNPVAMWREIHRVMKPGARIAVTTPNYYALRSSLRRWWRAVRRDGGGARIEDVLGVPTYGHHWKEYSRRELRRYFELLSPDFSCLRMAYTQEYMPALAARRGSALIAAVERVLPPLRPDLYLEIELTRKEKGIALAPHW
jgi:2-polyprenyl-6-hydroxyphenyl methylase/3-demethylubiquinone-9 3-methyltransferase